MRNRTMRGRVATILVVVSAALPTLCWAPANTWAQAPDGAFATLSPGGQKIARSLFEAQIKSTAPGAPTPLTLDQIAAKKQGHEGWGEVFKDMKTQGLVTEKNLGRVVSGFERQHAGQGAASGHDNANNGIVNAAGRSTSRGSDHGIVTGSGRGDAAGSSSASDGVRGGNGGGNGGGHGGGRR
jgi:hypothetical protein